jgi:hypothetical protein
MTLILRPHVALCSKKTRINIALRGRVKRRNWFYDVPLNLEKKYLCLISEEKLLIDTTVRYHSGGSMELNARTYLAPRIHGLFIT